MPLVKVNKAQLHALYRVFCRDKDEQRLYYRNPDKTITLRSQTWREFRKSVQGTFLMDGCVMVYWAGMWLGIEKDGYTHS